MERKNYIITVTLLIFGIIIAVGCGGGNDGITTPDSILNQGNTTEGRGYITIRVIWPQGEASELCSLSSGSEENTLTASMPGGTTGVKVNVREKDAPVDDIFVFPDGKKAENTINYPDEDRTTIGPLPPVWMIVRAGALVKSCGN